MATKKPTKSNPGNYELHYASDLTVLSEIQRVPTDARITQLAREWDRSKEGILLVAEITDGEHAGTLHVYDGGTRLRAKLNGAPSTQRIDEVKPQPNYVFETVVKPMTMKEAAEAFLSFNRDSRKPGAMDQYVIGVEAGEPVHIALKEVLDHFGVTAGYPPSRDTLAAIKAAERVIGMGSNDVPAGKQLLLDTLSLTRDIYHDGHAHDADLIQAIARLIHLNPVLLTTKAARSRLIEITSALSVGQWRMKAQNERGMEATSGGSSSRAVHLARQIGEKYNVRKKIGKLVLPPLAKESKDEAVAA